jgi:hypothetical protein
VKRTGYLECFSGVSGDMLLGALVDAGVPFALLAETAEALGVGARLEMRKVSRGGLAATKVDVIAPSEPAHTHGEHTHEAPPQAASTHAVSHAHVAHTHVHEHPHTHEDGHDYEHAHEHPHSHAAHRSLSAILAIIRSAPLAERVKTRSIRAFQLLGEAEATIHSMPVEEVHFHEVGAVDTIIDIVCSAAGVEALGVDRWLASSLNVGSGTVVCQHGRLPVPAPATLALLADAPVYSAGEPMERVTPTGAALLRMLDVSYAPLPTMRITHTGYGAGSRETPGQPNLLRLLVGDEVAETGVTEASAGEAIAVIEAVIDDCNPQILSYVSELLLAAGSWDVYSTAVQMKKGRSGVQLTVLCHPDLVHDVQEKILRETTTIGLRWRLENKLALAREFVSVVTRWGRISIKVARWPDGKVANVQPEFEDCRKIAAEHKIALKKVIEEAMRSYAVAEEIR